MIASKAHHNTATTKNVVASSNGIIVSLLRSLFLELPIALLFTLFLGSLLIQRVYHVYVVPIAKSYRRGEMIGGLFYEDYDNDFTYYNRHCGPDDISTRSANDLLIQLDHTEDEAANIMLQHGAVAFRNVLQNETATKLRQYLATKHLERDNQHNSDTSSLGYNEVFWSEQNRLSLGIGTTDHPAILEALEQIGSHPTITTALKGILGDDPAILEISTLTSLNGADDQGIHSDSDWFGSSLLYARNFLHSYSMFVALQDTSKDLGATTVCPGTHYCADVDLEELCLENGAFEVSTNGHTGHDGLLYKGDAFMFNQNIWHRGPRNNDPDGLDRIMFILTFATAKDTTADRRRQGLGTYYYQRFNLWGSTFDMLKDASKTMVQPWPFFRAMGLVNTRGITWIHQFCQQLANGEEFYNNEEIEELINLLDEGLQIPTFLRSRSHRWKRFIPETISLWVQFLAAANGVAVVTYLATSAVVCLSQGKPVSRSIFQTFKRLLVLLGTLALLSLTLSKYVDQTDLAQSVITGDVNLKPFPLKEEAPTQGEYGPTTFPERNDVLIGTRFDADFLASYNRFLDFHPGNYQWHSLIISAATSLPKALAVPVAKHIVHEVLQYNESGFHSRFLLQNPYSGAWSIMSKAEAQRETYRALVDRNNQLIGSLSLHLKRFLADARFGTKRGTAMARNFGERFVNHWISILYGDENSTPTTTLKIPSSQTVTSLKIAHVFPYRKTKEKRQVQLPDISPTKIVRRKTVDRVAVSPISDDAASEEEEIDDDIKTGDKVWVYFGDDEWYEGELVDVLDDELCLVFLYNTGRNIHVHIDDIREYAQLKEGDWVEVEDYDGETETFYKGTVTIVHPDGRCGVDFGDGDVAEKVRRENMVLIE